MGFFKKILTTFSSKPDLDWDELEEALVGGDIGIRLSMEILDKLRDMGRKVSAEDVVDVLRSEITSILGDPPPPLTPIPGKPVVILVVGVNGTGKTTSTAKLAAFLKNQGHSVMFAAADTFRAAAIEQLDIWAQRIGIPIVKGQYQADPSSVCFDAYQSAVKNNIDFLICDTAGRLHTRNNLMEELKKIERTISRNDEDAPHERFLVVDATTGSNALAQAKEFHNTVNLTGLIVTKLDGSGKGGVVVSIKNELGVPSRYIGTGEQLGDLAPFDPEHFVREILQ